MPRIEQQWQVPVGQGQTTLHFALSLPATPAPDTGWPLLCLLDGDWTWPIAQSCPDLAQCAVLYPYYASSAEHIRRARAWDYTPADAQGMPWPDPRVPNWLCGGAAAFLAQLNQQLETVLTAMPQLNPRNVSLFGHSYAGLFVLYALMQNTTSVQHFICASPSLWWRDPLVWKQLDEWAGRTDAVFTLIAGLDEKWYPNAQQGSTLRQGGTPTLPLMHALQSKMQAKVQYSRLITLDGAGHGQVLSQATLAALHLAQQSPSLT